MDGNLPPPLAKAKFDAAHKTYSARTGIKHEMRLMQVDGKPIDLYALHVNVMQQGGWTEVHNKDRWGIIGGSMGFVQFPASNTQTARSGPGVAQRLAQVYKEYLSGFDRVYINSVFDSRKKVQASGSSSPNPPIKNLTPGQPGSFEDLKPLQANIAQQEQSQALRSTEKIRSSTNFPPPLDKAKFNAAYQFHSAKTGIKHEMRLMNMDGRPIDLYALHVNIMREGGWTKVHNKNLWCVIGGRMGFVHSPASDTQPAISGPGVAHRLALVYKEYLLSFDQSYINSVMAKEAHDAAGILQPSNGVSSMHPGGLPVDQQVPGMPARSPNPGQIQVAQAFIVRAQAEFRQNLPTFRPFNLPSEDQAEYHSMFRQLLAQVDALSHRLPYLYYALRSEDAMRKVISMVMTVKYQERRSQSGNPGVIITPELLRSLLAQAHAANNTLTQFFSLPPPTAKADCTIMPVPPNTGKRPRDEESTAIPSTSAENTDASSSTVKIEPPSPKRIKPNPDAPPTEESKNREVAVNVKTEEDARQFDNQLTELTRDVKAEVKQEPN